jgi:hypothetical protein
MNNWQSRACYAAIAFLLFSTFLLMAASRTEAASDEFYLSIVGLKYDSTERISAFDLQVQGGQIVGAPRIPLGWTINISNGPGFSSEIAGKAIVGVEFVPPGDFVNKIVLIEVISDEMRKFPGAPQTTKVTGYVDLYRIDAIRRVGLSNSDFLMSPR